jgi:hypothetical protein
MEMDTNATIIEFFAMVLVFRGVYLVSQPNIRGLYVFIIAQILWSAFAIMKGAPFLLIQNVVLMGLNIYGIRNWRRKGVGVE